METTHGDLQQYHNEAVRDNPEYRMEGLLDVRMEEMADHLPTQIEAPDLVATPQEPWAASQWDIVNQCRAEMLYLKQKLNEHLTKPKQSDRL